MSGLIRNSQVGEQSHDKINNIAAAQQPGIGRIVCPGRVGSNGTPIDDLKTHVVPHKPKDNAKNGNESDEGEAKGSRQPQCLEQHIQYHQHSQPHKEVYPIDQSHEKWDRSNLFCVVQIIQSGKTVGRQENKQNET